MRLSCILHVLLLSIVCAEEQQTCSADDGSCTTVVSEMPNRPGFVEVAFGEDQQVGGSEAESTRRVIETTNRYMTEQVSVGDDFALVRNECKLRHELCSFWAAIGKPIIFGKSVHDHDRMPPLSCDLSFRVHSMFHIFYFYTHSLATVQVNAKIILRSCSSSAPPPANLATN